MSEGLFRHFPYPPQQWYPKVTASGPVTVSPSFTGDAVLLKTQSASLTADSVLLKTQSASFTADAWIAAFDIVCTGACGITVAGGVGIPPQPHWTFGSPSGITTVTDQKPTGAAAAIRYTSTGSQVYTRKAIARRVVQGRVYFYIEAYPTGGNSPFIELLNASGDLGLWIIDAAGSGGDTPMTLHGDVGSGPGADGPVVTLNTWHWVDFIADSSGATSTLKFRLDGGSEVTASNAQAAADMTDIRVGLGGSVTHTIWLANIVTSSIPNLYPMGQGAVEALRPSADGTHSFTLGDFKYNNSTNVPTNATDVYTYLDDPDLEDVSDYISQNVINAAGYVEVAVNDLSSGQDPIAVNVIGEYFSSSTAANTFGTKLNDGGTLANVLNPNGDGGIAVGLADVSTISTNPQNYERIFRFAPSTGGLWTYAKANALLVRAGYSTDVTPIPGISGLVLEVALPLRGFTADAVIKKEQTASLTADAVLLKTQSASFTGDAVLLKTQSASFTADAVIVVTRSASLTADAVIKATINASFTADAVIKREQAASLTANAVIKKEQTNSLTADALLLRIQTASLTADAVVKATVSTNFTADALIVREVLLDTFTRTVPVGLGTSDSGTTYTRQPSLSSGSGNASVNGSYAITDADTIAAFVGYPSSLLALVQFDFFVPQNAGSDSQLFYELDLSDGSLSVYVFAFPASGSDWSIDVGLGSGAFVNFTADDDTWYRTKAWIDVAGTTYRVKVWKVGDPEPDWDTTGTSDGSAFFDSNLWIGLGNDATANGLDNLHIWTATATTNTTRVFTADAVIATGQVTVNTSFTADAIIKREQTASLTADAVVKATISASLTADAAIKREQLASLTADAILLKTQAASLTADAVLLRTQSASLTADAVIKATRAASLTADAITKREQLASLTADAVIFKTQSASLTADAVILKTQSASFTADAVIVVTISRSLTADAVIKREQLASLTADAVIRAEQTASFTVDAILLKTQAASLTADAVIFATISRSLTADAVIMPVFTADAILLRTQTASLTADAVIMPVFTADAVIRTTQTASFTADAWIFGTGSAAFTADAVIRVGQTASFSADAVLLRTQSASLTANAVLFATISASFTADAVISLAAGQGFTADAVIYKEQSAALTVDAEIRYVGVPVWTTPGNHVSVSTTTPTFNFRMPQAFGSMHFWVELDTVDTFDGADYQSHKSHSDLAGWEFFDGVDWQPIPQAGVDSIYAGREARYTLQTPLSNGVWFRRVRAGVI